MRVQYVLEVSDVETGQTILAEEFEADEDASAKAEFASARQTYDAEAYRVELFQTRVVASNRRSHVGDAAGRGVSR